MAQDRLSPSSISGSSNIKQSTKDILIMLRTALLKAADIVAKDPAAEVTVKISVVVDGKTAQVGNQFATLPDISIAVERVDVSLSKLKSINNPTIQAKADVFTKQAQQPTNNAKNIINNVDLLRGDYKQLKVDELNSSKQALDKIRNADGKGADLLIEIKGDFKGLITRVDKLSARLKTEEKELKLTDSSLNSLFKQVFDSIPIMARADIASKVAAIPPTPQSDTPAPE